VVNLYNFISSKVDSSKKYK